MNMEQEEQNALNIEDTSQLSMIAYELEAYGGITNQQHALQRLRTPDARKIGEAILNGTSDPDDRIRRAAEYFMDWAKTTARRSVELSHRSKRE